MLIISEPDRHVHQPLHPLHRLFDLTRKDDEQDEHAARSGADRDARWCVAQYHADLARRFAEGFDPRRSIPADDEGMRPPRGAILVATIDGEPVACGAVKPVAPGIGSVKRMWVADSVRGLGIGRRMLRALEAEASTLGLRTLRLETNRALVEAIALYEREGYVRVAAFNADPYADFWFEKQLP